MHSGSRGNTVVLRMYVYRASLLSSVLLLLSMALCTLATMSLLGAMALPPPLSELPLR
jgi:hypothetical protein